MTLERIIFIAGCLVGMSLSSSAFADLNVSSFFSWVGSWIPSINGEDSNVHGWSELNSDDGDFLDIDYGSLLASSKLSEDDDVLNTFTLDKNERVIISKPEALEIDTSTQMHLSDEQIFPDNPHVLMANWLRLFSEKYTDIAWHYWADVYRRYPEIGLTFLDDPRAIEPTLSEEMVHFMRLGILMHAPIKIFSHAVHQMPYSFVKDEIYHWGKFNMSHPLLKGGTIALPIALVHRNLIPLLYIHYLATHHILSEEDFRNRIFRILALLKEFPSSDVANILILDSSYAQFKMGLDNPHCFGKLKTKGVCTLSQDFNLPIETIIAFIFAFAQENDDQCKAIAVALLEKVLEAYPQNLEVLRLAFTGDVLEKMGLFLADKYLKLLDVDYILKKLTAAYDKQLSLGGSASEVDDSDEVINSASSEILL